MRLNTNQNDTSLNFKFVRYQVPILLCISHVLSEKYRECFCLVSHLSLALNLLDLAVIKVNKF